MCWLSSSLNRYIIVCYEKTKITFEHERTEAHLQALCIRVCALLLTSNAPLLCEVKAHSIVQIKTPCFVR